MFSTDWSQPERPNAGSSALSDRPRVSIIIPTRNRARFIQTLLTALTAQIYPSDRMEVIVVDNSSSDNTEEVVRAMAEEAPFEVLYLSKADEGPAAARNLGISHSTGKLLAFTDSDCLPSPDWLLTAVGRLDDEDGLVCGPVVPIWRKSDGFFVHQISGVFRENGIYPTANVIYRRSAVEEVGGFAEEFGAYAWGKPKGGEDTNLAWRVKRAGYGTAFAPQAVVYHQATPLTYKQWLLSPLQAQIIPQLVADIPELRRSFLWHRYFLGAHTAAFDLALLGLALALRYRAGLLLTLPWLRMCWPAFQGDAWPPQRWPQLASKMALVLTSCTVLASVMMKSSIQNRRMVL